MTTTKQTAAQIIRDWVEHDLDEHYEDGYELNQIEMPPTVLIGRIEQALRDERNRAIDIINRFSICRDHDQPSHCVDAYIALVGPIPGTFPHGLTVDHLCRNRPCVNPAHMELVSRGENSLRGDTIVARCKSKTHCVNGHEFTPENTGSVPARNNARCCKACQKIRRDRFNREQRERKEAQGL